MACIGAILDNNTNPLGDGSLLQSYTFQDTLTSEQGTNTLVGTGSWVYEKVAPTKAGKYVRLVTTSDVITQTPSLLSAETDYSISVWHRFDQTLTWNWFTLKLGDGATDRYGLTLQQSSGTGGTPPSYKYTLSLHKNAVVAVTPAFIPIENDSWHLFTYTYTASTQLNKVYIDETEILSATQQMKFSSGNALTLGDGMVGAYDQLMIWSKPLTVTDIGVLLNTVTSDYAKACMTATGTLSGAGTFIGNRADVKDLFGDGSCKMLFRVDNNFLEADGVMEMTASHNGTGGVFVAGGDINPNGYRWFGDNTNKYTLEQTLPELVNPTGVGNYACSFFMKVGMPTSYGATARDTIVASSCYLLAKQYYLTVQYHVNSSADTTANLFIMIGGTTAGSYVIVNLDTTYHVVVSKIGDMGYVYVNKVLVKSFSITLEGRNGTVTGIGASLDKGHKVTIDQYRIFGGRAITQGDVDFLYTEDNTHLLPTTSPQGHLTGTGTLSGEGTVTQGVVTEGHATGTGTLSGTATKLFGVIVTPDPALLSISANDVKIPPYDETVVISSSAEMTITANEAYKPCTVSPAVIVQADEVVQLYWSNPQNIIDGNDATYGDYQTSIVKADDEWSFNISGGGASADARLKAHLFFGLEGGGGGQKTTLYIQEDNVTTVTFADEETYPPNTHVYIDEPITAGTSKVSLRFNNITAWQVQQFFYVELHEVVGCEARAIIPATSLKIEANEATVFLGLDGAEVTITANQAEVQIVPKGGSLAFSIISKIETTATRNKFDIISLIEQTKVSQIIRRVRT